MMAEFKEKRATGRIPIIMPANIFIEKERQRGFAEVLGTVVDISKAGFGFVVEGAENVKRATPYMDTHMTVILQTIDDKGYSYYHNNIILEKFELVWFKYNENSLHIGFQMPYKSDKWVCYVNNRRAEIFNNIDKKG